MLEIAEIKTKKYFQPHTKNDTLIFGQHDPGKPPYTSWGKPVQKLLISDKCFYNEREILKKISASNKYNLSHFSCLTTTSENVQTTKQKHQ